MSPATIAVLSVAWALVGGFALALALWTLVIGAVAAVEHVWGGRGA